MKLHMQVIRNSAGITLKLDGILDETAELPAFDLTNCGRVLIDLDKLTMINSIGCRKWIHWLKTFPKDIQISLVNCSRVIVNQVNILGGFIAPGVLMESVYVPYFCESCGKDETVLVSLVDAKSPGWNIDHIADEKDCSHCKAKAEIDVIKSRYFQFLFQKSA